MNKLQELVDEIHKMSGIGKITLTERIQALLTSEVERVIGEDEKMGGLSNLEVEKVYARNQLRKEQRKALSDIGGGKI